MKNKISIVIGVVAIATLSFGFVNSKKQISTKAPETTTSITTAPLGGIPLQDKL
jgi:hypothetical protein